MIPKMDVIKRSFIVGDEWLFYKIYSGPKISETILTENLLPLITKLQRQKKISKWFFIRYEDPKPHIRIRFLVAEKKFILNIITDLFQELKPLIDQNLIWKVQLDTYHRELERYGINTIELSETLFYIDSDAVLNFLDLIEGTDGEQLRWLYALRTIDCLLDSFGYILPDKQMLMDELKTGFGKEFSMSKPLKLQLDRKYREKRPLIEEFMGLVEHEEYGPILEIFEIYSQRSKPIVKNLLLMERNKQLEISKNQLVSSYIHMSMTRLFKSKNRLNEMVCYDFLYRYYKSLTARSK